MKTRTFFATCVFYISTASASDRSASKKINLSETSVVKEPMKTTFRDWKKEVYALYDMMISTDLIEKYINERLTPKPIRLKWDTTFRSSAEFEQIESQLMAIANPTDYIQKVINQALTYPHIKLKWYNTRFTDWDLDKNDYWHRSTTPLGQTFRTNPYIDKLLFEEKSTQQPRTRLTFITSPPDSKERPLNAFEKLERLYRLKLTTRHQSTPKNEPTERVKRSINEKGESWTTSSCSCQQSKIASTRFIVQSSSETEEMFDSFVQAHDDLHLRKMTRNDYAVGPTKTNIVTNQFRREQNDENVRSTSSLDESNYFRELLSYEDVVPEKPHYLYNNCNTELTVTKKIGQSKVIRTLSYKKIEELIKYKYHLFEKKFTNNPMLVDLYNGKGWNWRRNHTGDISDRKIDEMFEASLEKMLKKVSPYRRTTDLLDKVFFTITRRPRRNTTAKITCKAFLGFIKSFNEADRKRAEEAYLDMSSGQSSEPRDLSDLNITFTKGGKIRNITNPVLLYSMRYMTDEEIKQLREDYQLLP